MQRIASHPCAYRADHPRKVASETNRCDAIDVERSGTNLVLAPPFSLPPVASLTAPVEIPTRSTGPAWTIAPTPPPLAARAPVRVRHRPVALALAHAFMSNGI